MSILKSTNSGTHGIIADKGLLITWLKELGYDTRCSYYVATNDKYWFLPNVNFEEVLVRYENRWQFHINIITTSGDQHNSFSHKYIINTYADFLEFENDINRYIDKNVNSKKHK